MSVRVSFVAESFISLSEWQSEHNMKISRKNVINKSSFFLKSHHIELLGYGLNFALPHEKRNLFSFVEHLEKNKKSPESIKYNCIFMNLDQIFQSLKSDFNNFFPKRFRVALAELKKEKSIRICKADKGSKL